MCERACNWILQLRLKFDIKKFRGVSGALPVTSCWRFYSERRLGTLRASLGLMLIDGDLAIFCFRWQLYCKIRTAAKQMRDPPYYECWETWHHFLQKLDFGPFLVHGAPSKWIFFHFSPLLVPGLKEQDQWQLLSLESHFWRAIKKPRTGRHFESF